jgi:hypothetical protein
MTVSLVLLILFLLPDFIVLVFQVLSQESKGVKAHADVEGVTQFRSRFHPGLLALALHHFLIQILEPYPAHGLPFSNVVRGVRQRS